MGETIYVRVQAANSVAQSLRQHRDDAIGQINAVTAPPRLAIECTVRSYVGGNICDVNAEPPTAGVVDLFNVDRVIKVARVIRIDRDDELIAQIFAPLDEFLICRLWHSIRFVEYALWKRCVQIIYPT